MQQTRSPAVSRSRGVIFVPELAILFPSTRYPSAWTILLSLPFGDLRQPPDDTVEDLWQLVMTETMSF
jgi:hypothetical protein